jgi:hypothetical protein
LIFCSVFNSFKYLCFCKIRYIIYKRINKKRCSIYLFFSFNGQTNSCSSWIGKQHLLFPVWYINNKSLVIVHFFFNNEFLKTFVFIFRFAYSIRKVNYFISSSPSSTLIQCENFQFYRMYFEWKWITPIISVQIAKHIFFITVKYNQKLFTHPPTYKTYHLLSILFVGSGNASVVVQNIIPIAYKFFLYIWAFENLRSTDEQTTDDKKKKKGKSVLFP